MTASTSNVLKTMTYTDSSATNLVKHVTVLAMIQLRVSANAPSDYDGTVVTITIGSNTKSYALRASKYSGDMATAVMFSARVSDRVVTCSIRSQTNGIQYATTGIISPTMMVSRGSGAFE